MADIATIKEEDIIMNSRDVINSNFDLLKKSFAGSEYPENPVEGMRVFKNGAWETYKSDSWTPDNQLHRHDEIYYTETEINQFLSGKSNSGHNHDGRYYTETEINKLIQGKAALNHIHDDRYLTKAESGGRTISTAQPSGGANGDVWYRYG